MPQFIGIDPGVKGGLVVISGNSINQVDLKRCVVDGLPNSSVSTNLNNCEVFIEPGAVAIVERIKPSIFGIRKSSMSILYGSFMEWKALLTAVGVPFEEVDAEGCKSWLREFVEPRKKGESQSHWKNRHRQAARILFNDGEISTEMCDAYLLAEFCRRKHLGLLESPEWQEKKDADQNQSRKGSGGAVGKGSRRSSRPRPAGG